MYFTLIILIPLNQEADDETEGPLPNIMNLMFYFEQAGIGFGREESYRIYLALKQVVDNHPVQKIRLWGNFFDVVRCIVNNCFIFKQL